MGFDRWRGGKGEDPEAANRRDNNVNVLVRRAFGNPKKTGGDRRWLTFAAASVNFASHVGKVYRSCGGVVFGGGM